MSIMKKNFDGYNKKNQVLYFIIGVLDQAVLRLLNKINYFFLVNNNRCITAYFNK